MCEALGLDPVFLTIEFSYHAGDDIYKKQMADGVLVCGLGRDLTPEEAGHPLLETLAQEARDSDAAG